MVLIKQYGSLAVCGPIHHQQLEADQEREAVLRGRGYRVLRVTNEQVWGSLEGVLVTILQAATREKEQS